MECSQVFSIPVTYNDLQISFTLKEVCQQLEELDRTTVEIFHRLQFKIDQQQSRVQNIDKRITTCQEKVNVISARGSSNKPTTIFSTAKYPVPKALPPMKTLYFDKQYAENPPLGPEPEEDVHFLPSDPLTSAQKSQETADLVSLFGRTNTYQAAQKAQVNMATEGLGKLPDYIPSVGSVLLFNSGENPYQHYTSWDNLLGTEFDVEEEKAKELAKAPKTLVEGDELPSIEGLNFDFQPTMGQHLDLSTSLPTNLPLDNIADYKYTADRNASTSIAPSMFQDQKKTQLPELPQISDFAAAPSAHEQHVVLPDAGSQVLLFDENVGFPPPPPPSRRRTTTIEKGLPPPMPPLTKEDSVEDMPPPPPPDLVNHQYDDDDVTPPPPPPQEQPSVEQPQVQILSPDQALYSFQQDSEEIMVTTPVVQQNPRSSLLDAIRQGGHLKKVQAREAQDDRRIEAAKLGVAKPLSIADEMRQKLNRRQAIISGKQDKLEQRRERASSSHRASQVMTAEVVPGPLALPKFDDDHDDNTNALRSGAQKDERSEDILPPAFGDEGDMLAQLRVIQEKQLVKPPLTPASVVESEQSSVSNFESRMTGLDAFQTQRYRRDSLDDLSEASDWSDEDS